MTPNNREEMIEVCAMAEAERLCYGGWGSWGNMPRDIQHAFTEPVRQTFLALDIAGIALVPKVATEEMVEAASLAIEKTPICDEYDTWRPEARRGHSAMLSASPFRSKQHGGGDD